MGEQYNHTELVSQVFWGLLACEILNLKAREVTELTTVRRIKDMLKVLYSEQPMKMLHQTSWLLHWCLVFSFTAEKSNGLFAALLADKANFGDAYLNVVQLRCPQLMRHMVASFLLGRSSSYQPQIVTQNIRTTITPLSKDALQTVALPMVLAEEEIYSDSFTKFTTALLEDFDFDAALKLANQMAEDAKNDILLRPHAEEIKRQACLYVFEVQCRIYQTASDVTAFCTENKVDQSDAVASVVNNLEEQGLIVKTEGSKVAIQGNLLDVKGKIHSMTVDLLKRTHELEGNLQGKVS